MEVIIATILRGRIVNADLIEKAAHTKVAAS